MCLNIKYEAPNPSGRIVFMVQPTSLKVSPDNYHQFVGSLRHKEQQDGCPGLVHSLHITGL